MTAQLDQQRRRILEGRRELLKLKVRRADESRTFRAIAPELCALGVRFSKLPPVACVRALGTLIDGPGQDERLLWTEIGGGQCQHWSTGDERDRILRAALVALSSPSEAIAVIWHPVQTGLRIQSGALQQVLGTVFAELSETIWLVAANGGKWLIEVSITDREICWTPNVSYRC